MVLTENSEFDPESLHVTQVAVSAETSAAVTKGGFLFTWSTSGDTVGTLGRAIAAPKAPAADDISLAEVFARATNIITLSASALSAPQVVPALIGKHITAVATGFHHLLALSDEGEVFACGKVETGALGLPFEFLDRGQGRFVDTPRSVTGAVAGFMAEIRDAAQLQQLRVEQAKARSKADAGRAQHHNIIKSKSGDTANSANNNSVATVQVSEASPYAAADADAADPTQLPRGVIGDIGKVTAIAAGFAHSAFLGSDGAVWTCGKNSHGELGLTVDLGADVVDSVDFRLHYLPTRVRGALEGYKVVQIACGYHHTAVLTDKGTVLTWGSNRHGQCGRPHEVPTLATAMGKKGKRAAHQAFALRVGVVRIPGLGQPDRETGVPVTVTSVACGPYDTALTLSNGRVLFCGSYLDEKGLKRPPFALGEFDSLATTPPATAAENMSQAVQTAIETGAQAAAQAIATIFSKDAVSPAVREMDTTASAASDEGNKRYFAQKIVMGINYAFALGKPRG